MVLWSDLHAKIHRRLRQHQWLPQNADVLVAVSGGQDSLCLLQLLLDLQPKWGWGLRAVHGNHRWRADADANAEYVAELCDRWRVPCEVVTAAVPPTSEAAARQWRYGVFAQLAAPETRVVTGHTATDRAETLLYNLVRGSGADGLQALGWERSLTPERPQVRLVRPLLELTRAETGAFCQQRQIQVWEDGTNCDRTFARNRLRLDVMPYLQEHFNPAVETTLAQTAEILSAEVNLLEELTHKTYQRVVHCQNSCVSVQRRLLSAAPLAIQRRVLRRVLSQQVSAQVCFEHVEKLITLLHAPNQSQSDPFPGGAIARIDNDRLILLSKQAQNRDG